MAGSNLCIPQATAGPSPSEGQGLCQSGRWMPGPASSWAVGKATLLDRMANWQQTPEE